MRRISVRERVSTQQPPKGIVGPDDEDEMILTPSCERWVVAVHEAGHAVIAERVGFKVKEVRVENAYLCCVRPDWQIDIPPSGISSETADEVDAGKRSSWWRGRCTKAKAGG
jgi:hypothetical protein